MEQNFGIDLIVVGRFVFCILWGMEKRFVERRVDWKRRGRFWPRQKDAVGYPSAKDGWAGGSRWKWIVRVRPREVRLPHTGRVVDRFCRRVPLGRSRERPSLLYPRLQASLSLSSSSRPPFISLSLFPVRPFPSRATTQFFNRRTAHGRVHVPW